MGQPVQSQLRVVERNGFEAAGRPLLFGPYLNMLPRCSNGSELWWLF
jgi:hypothetical protein